MRAIHADVVSQASRASCSTSAAAPAGRLTGKAAGARADWHGLRIPRGAALGRQTGQQPPPHRGRWFWVTLSCFYIIFPLFVGALRLHYTAVCSSQHPRAMPRAICRTTTAQHAAPLTDTHRIPTRYPHVLRHFPRCQVVSPRHGYPAGRMALYAGVCLQPAPRVPSDCNVLHKRGLLPAFRTDRPLASATRSRSLRLVRKTVVSRQVV